jgi:hypothetical protein
MKGVSLGGVLRLEAFKKEIDRGGARSGGFHQLLKSAR